MICEQDIYRALAEGVIPSPTTWQGSTYVCIRATGVGVAYRASHNEYVYRDPAVWNSARMLKRFEAIPLQWEHPPSGTITSRSFADACIGLTRYAYIHPEEDAPWVVCRVIDKNADELLATGHCCSSPGVVIDPATCGEIEIDGRRLLVESEPIAVDHLAIVWMGEDLRHPDNKGVWQRDDGPGVKTDSIKTDWAAAYDYA